MKRLIIFVFCLFVTLKAVSIENTQYEYIPFQSTSPNLQYLNYNTVRPLNDDGTVSMDYTTYRYTKRRFATSEWDSGDEGPGIGEIDDPVPIGDPDIYVITFLLGSYLGYRYLKNRKSKIYY